MPPALYARLHVPTGPDPMHDRTAAAAERKSSRHALQMSPDQYSRLLQPQAAMSGYIAHPPSRRCTLGLLGKRRRPCSGVPGPSRTRLYGVCLAYALLIPGHSMTSETTEKNLPY